MVVGEVGEKLPRLLSIDARLFRTPEEVLPIEEVITPFCFGDSTREVGGGEEGGEGGRGGVIEESSGVLLIGESLGTDTTLCFKTFDLTTTTVEAGTGSFLSAEVAVATWVLVIVTGVSGETAKSLLVVVPTAGMEMGALSERNLVTTLSESETVSVSCLLSLPGAGGL